MTIDEMQTFIATKAREIYNKDHYHVPMLVLDFFKAMDIVGNGKKVEIAIIPARWKTETDRDGLSVAMKAFCGLGFVRNIAIVHEVYMLETHGKTVDVRPSEHPDSISVLFLHIESSSGEVRTGYWPVIDADTRKARLGQWQSVENPGEMAGRFMNFFSAARRS